MSGREGCFWGKASVFILTALFRGLTITSDIGGVMAKNSRTLWYSSGLHFECGQCGRCCSGPGEGYIWITKPEIKFVSDFLRISLEQLRQKFLKRIGLRTSIVEHPATRDCIFLQEIGNEKRCVIYPVRPNQCRTWPFWPENLQSIDKWNEACRKCPGINRGRFYSLDEIEKIKKSKQWWYKSQQKSSH